MQNVRHDFQLANRNKDRLKMSRGGSCFEHLVQKHNGDLTLIEKKLFGPSNEEERKQGNKK